jgi:translation initiation factor IF-3
MTIKREMRQDKRAAPKAPINENISAREVRLIGADGEQIGIVSIDEALRIAEEEAGSGRNLRRRSPTCLPGDGLRQVDLRKKKQIAAAKKNQKQIQVKEIKFRPGTEEGDYQVKLRNLVRFLSDGDKAKVSCDSAAVRWPTRSWGWNSSSGLKLTCSSTVRSNSILRWKDAS